MGSMPLENIAGKHVEVFRFKDDSCRLNKLLLQEAAFFGQIEDLTHSKECSELLLKEKDRFQKSLLFESMIISYARCFNSQYTNGSLDYKEVYKKNMRFREAHENVMLLRNQCVAHNDVALNPVVVSMFKVKDTDSNKSFLCPSFLPGKIGGFGYGFSEAPAMIGEAIKFCVKQKSKKEQEKREEVERLSGRVPADMLEEHPFYCGLAPVPKKVQEKEFQRLCEATGLKIP